MGCVISITSEIPSDENISGNENIVNTQLVPPTSSQTLIPRELLHIIHLYRTHDPTWFNISKIRGSNNIVIIGKKNTGKTTLIKDICVHLSRDIPVFIIANTVEDVSHSYEGINPPTLILRNNDEINERMRELIIHQQQIQRNARVPVCVVIDDSVIDEMFFRSRELRTLVMNGHNLKISVILALQSFKRVPPYIRQNIDYAFCLRNNNFTERKFIREELFERIQTKREFDELFTQYTNNFGCIVADNTNNITHQKYSKYKANYGLNPRLSNDYWDNNFWDTN